MINEKKAKKIMAEDQANKESNYRHKSLSSVSHADDRTDAIGNHRIGLDSGPKEHHSIGHVIHFVHVPTNKTCHFKAFLTSWSDQFKQDWKDYTTVGRMDPIKVYARTSRQITFSLTIPSYDLEEAAYNLNEVQNLIQMSYPTFETLNLGAAPSGQSNSTSANSPSAAAAESAVNKIGAEQASTKLNYTDISTMVSPPFFRIKFANWLNDSSLDRDMNAIDALNSGLYGTIDTVKFEPDLSGDGGFYGAADMYGNRADSQSEQILIPKALKLDITFTVLHTNKLGYNASSKYKNARTQEFPYNAGKILNKIKSKTIKVK